MLKYTVKMEGEAPAEFYTFEMALLWALGKGVHKEWTLIKEIVDDV
jgi:hypothetical protein